MSTRTTARLAAKSATGKICHICGKTARVRNDGNLWRHRNQRGTWCGGNGRRLPVDLEEPGRAGIEAAADWDQLIEFNAAARQTWQKVGAGEPKVPCPMCQREVGWRLRGRDGADLRLARHKHPQGGWCSTSVIPPLFPATDETDESDNGAGSWVMTGGPWHATGEKARNETELATWWRDLAEAEIEMVVAKALEYGATDLRDLGYQIWDMAGSRPTPSEWPGPDQQQLDASATEIGIAFYTAGKLARIVAAIREGRRPSYDSWHDVGIYARMAQRVHTHGGWPGGGL